MARGLDRQCTYLLTVADGSSNLVAHLAHDQVVTREQARHRIKVRRNEAHVGVGLGSRLHKGLQRLLIRRAVATEGQVLAARDLRCTSTRRARDEHTTTINQ